jgi:lipoprotein-anchoring transpeptidase ErfK/SrfK
MTLPRMALAAALSVAWYPASANVLVHVRIATQRMTVNEKGAPVFKWPVSTGRKGYRTPTGRYRVQRMVQRYRSRKYKLPMPYSLFYRGGYAIHASYETRMLGRPASHGCVHLSPGNARTLYRIVQKHGGARIIVAR